MEPTLSLPTANLVAGAFSIVFLLLLPIAATVAGHHWLKVGWRYAFYGAAVFLVFQLLTRVPVLEIFGPRVQALVHGSPVLLWGWLFVLALTAGLFEEVGRYFGFRVFFRHDEKTWAKAVMFGIGHGGLESLWVGGTAVVSTVQLWTLSHGGLDRLPAPQREQMVSQLTALASQPAWLQLAGGWERLWALLIQIAFAVIVLQVFIHGRLVWLWLAIAGHTLVDLTAVGLVQALMPNFNVAMVTVEAVVGLFGLAALWTIIHFSHDARTLEQAAPPSGRATTTMRRLAAGGHA